MGGITSPRNEMVVARKHRLLAIGAVVLSVMGVAAAATFGFVRGRIVVNVAAKDGSTVGHFDLFVDGKEVACKRSPCVLSKRAIGSYQLELAADGFARTAQTARVSARESTVVDFIVDALPTRLRVSSPQPGLTLFVDQNEIGKLPQDVAGLSIGRHSVRVTGGPFYEPVERWVELLPGAPAELGPITLPLRKADETSRAYEMDDGALVAHAPLGPLDRKQVQLTMSRYKPSLNRACWLPALGTREASAPHDARLTVAITISPSGSVRSATPASDPQGYRGLGQCVRSRVLGWQFPPSSIESKIKIPFEFSGG